MKSADEIRAHMAALAIARLLPCDCKSSGHERECETGWRMMDAVMHTLAWILDEDQEMQEMVDALDRQAKAFLAAEVKPTE